MGFKIFKPLYNGGIMRSFILFLLVMISFNLFCTDYLRLKSLSYPLSNYREDSRKVNELFKQDNKLYIGSGDYGINTGPTPIVCYDLNNGKMINEFTVDDEAVMRIIYQNGNLMIPGADATEDWTFGNVYLKNDKTKQQWKKYRNIAKGLHIFDMAFYKDKLFCSSGSSFSFDENNQPAMGCIYASSDSAETWNLSYMTSADDYSVSRVDQLIPFNGKLYAFMHRFYATEKRSLPEHFQSAIPGDSLRQLMIMKSDPMGKNDFLSYDGQSWSYIDMIFDENIALISPWLFDNKILLECVQSEYAYSTDSRYPLIKSLYYTFDGEKTQKIELPFTKIIDSKQSNDKLYLLARINLQPVVAVFNKDLSFQILNLPDKIYPLSLEVSDQNLYIGAVDGNLYTCDFSSDKTTEVIHYPLSFSFQSDIPVNDRLFNIIVQTRDDLIKLVFCRVEKKNQMYEIKTENITSLLLFPESDIDKISVNGKIIKTPKGKNYKGFKILISGKKASAEGLDYLQNDYKYEAIPLTEINETLKPGDPDMERFYYQAMMAVVKADFAVNIPGSFARSLEKGIVSVDDIYAINYRNKILTLTLNGKEWADLFKVLNSKKEISFFYQESIMNQIPDLLPEKTYTVVMNDYLFEKMCQYSGKKYESNNTNLLIAQAMIKWLKAGNPIR